MFSAYDLKKIIPRAIFALVAANLSWPIMALVINAIEALGDGAQQLIMAPFGASGTLGVSVNGGSAFMGVVLTAIAAGAALVGLIPVVGLAVTGIFGLLFAFGIIMLRRVFLVGLIIAAPAAIALSVFPQTESWAKKWWDWFSKLLLMYPFIMAFFGLSEVAAGILSRTAATGTAAGLQSVIYQLGAVAVLIAPYFLIGKALSLAGGTIGKVAGMVNNKDKGLIDRSKKWEAGRVAENRLKGRTGTRYDNDTIRGRVLNQGLRRVLNPRDSLTLDDSRRSAAAVGKQQAALAEFLKAHPELEKLSDDEAELLSMGSEREARRRIDRKVAEATARGEDGAKVRRDLELALATGMRKSGGYNGLASQIAFAQAVKAGRVASHELDEVAGKVAAGITGNQVEQEALKTSMLTMGEAGYKESSQLMHSQLAAIKDPVTGERVVSRAGGPGGALSAVIDAKDDAQRASAMEALPQDARILLHNTVNGAFDGSGKVSHEQLGKMDGNSRATVIASIQEQVNGTIAQLRAGNITADEAARQLSDRRADVLTLAQASTNEKNQAGATAATELLGSIDQAIVAHNSVAGAAGGPVIDHTAVGDSSTAVFQSRMGGAGNRPTGP